MLGAREEGIEKGRGEVVAETIESIVKSLREMGMSEEMIREVVSKSGERKSEQKQ